jgi:hypothetical protein
MPFEKDSMYLIVKAMRYEIIPDESQWRSVKYLDFEGTSAPRIFENLLHLTVGLMFSSRRGPFLNCE